MNNRNPAVSDSQVLAYLLLNVALERFQKTPAELLDVERQQALLLAQRQYTLEQRILNAPEAARCVVPATRLETALAEIRARYPDHDGFVADLKANGMHEASFVGALQRALHVEAVLEQVADQGAQVNEIDADIYYYMHPEKFKKPEIRTARHILITINPEYPENTRENAWQRIQTIAARLQQKPEHFDTQAQKHSECPTGLQGGVLGQLTPGTLFPALDAALFSLAVGQISAILESELGFHLLRCDAIQPATLIPLREARPQIIAHLQTRQRRLCQKHWIAHLPRTQQPATQEKCA